MALLLAIPMPRSFSALPLGCCGRSSGRSNSQGSDKNVTLLNVSYDPTREFYAEFNESFKQHTKRQTTSPSRRTVPWRLWEASSAVIDG